MLKLCETWRTLLEKGLEQPKKYFKASRTEDAAYYSAIEESEVLIKNHYWLRTVADNDNPSIWVPRWKRSIAV